MFLPVLLAKFLSAGAVAQAATGATVALVAFTGVGAVGALPDPVQDTFATVVAEITPLEPPTSEETTDEVVPEEVLPETVPVAVPEGAGTGTTEDADVVDEAAATEAYVKEWALEGPDGSESFTAWVHEGNKDGRVKDWLRSRGMTFGNVVSAWANGKGFSDAELAALGADLDEPAEAPTEPDADVVVEDAPETEQAEVEVTEDRGSRGNGNSNGSGKGKSNGKGNGKN